MGQQYLWALENWLENSNKNKPPEYNQELAGEIETWLGEKNPEVRLLTALKGFCATAVCVEATMVKSPLTRMHLVRDMSVLRCGVLLACQLSPQRQRRTWPDTGLKFFLESSNVEIINEMVDMIAAQRAYELLDKGIKAADEMMRTATNIR